MPTGPGELLGYASAIIVAVTGLWTVYGKAKDSAWAQAEKIRLELQKQLDDFRGREDKKDAALRESLKRTDELEDQLNRSSTNLKVVLNFLRDVIGGSFDLAWIQQRARDLLGRITQ